MSKGIRSLGHLSNTNPDHWRNIPDWWLGPFWVGDFAPEVPLSDYGSKEFHGRFHPAIPWVAMCRFTKPGDIVWDCFAGSGTTYDVGDVLDREVLATDLHPEHPCVTLQDASKWNPGKDTVALGIMHPPYMDIIDYESPMSDATDVNHFATLFSYCFDNMDIALKPGRVVVLVVGEVWKEGELIPLEYTLDWYITAVKGYRRIGRIVKDFGQQTKGGAISNPKDTNLWKYRLVKWGYFRNGIDTILFYQKPGVYDE